MQAKLKWMMLGAVAVGAIAIAMQATDTSVAVGRPVIGRVENVVLQDEGMKLKSRIDTGAGVSSIDATIVEIKKPKKKGGAETVVFEVQDENGKVKRIERPVVAWHNIKRKGAEGFDRRPTVMMDFCLGGRQVEARVNLADRSAFLYPLLIGRNVLKAGDFLIDPEQTFMEHPVCP